MTRVSYGLQAQILVVIYYIPPKKTSAFLRLRGETNEVYLTQSTSGIDTGEVCHPLKSPQAPSLTCQNAHLVLNRDRRSCGKINLRSDRNAADELLREKFALGSVIELVLTCGKCGFHMESSRCFPAACCPRGVRGHISTTHFIDHQHKTHAGLIQYYICTVSTKLSCDTQNTELYGLTTRAKRNIIYSSLSFVYL